MTVPPETWKNGSPTIGAVGGRSRPAGALVPELIDVAKVAVLLGVTQRHVQRLVTERRIPYLKVGRFVRFDPGELVDWLDDQRVHVHIQSGPGR
jgi:excisionase family DNA binding protein